MSQAKKVIYCNCTYAKIIPEDRKQAVLDGLVESEQDVTMVPDLCESAASKDPKLQEWLGDGPACVIACYKRSIKWLAHNAGVTLHDGVEVLNMREEEAESILKEVEKAHV